MTEQNINIKPAFLNLWPTVFMQLSLPGHESANPVIADLILSKNAAEMEPEDCRKNTQRLWNQIGLAV